MITGEFVARANGLLQLQPEITHPSYSMFNTGSTEVEVAEFLYALVRLIKPVKILETGTHYGVSAAYMARGLQDNGNWGMNLTTLEIFPHLRDASVAMWNKVGVAQFIDCQIIPSQHFQTVEKYDLIFLDSEPQYRFDEFVRFWPNCRPGGFILIHDLHPHMGHTDQTQNDMYDWPYGDFRAKLGPYIKAHDVQVMSFPSPRGFTLFQKVGDNFNTNRYLKGEI